MSQHAASESSFDHNKQGSPWCKTSRREYWSPVVVNIVISNENICWGQQIVEFLAYGPLDLINPGAPPTKTMRRIILIGD